MSARLELRDVCMFSVRVRSEMKSIREERVEGTRELDRNCDEIRIDPSKTCVNRSHEKTE